MSNGLYNMKTPSISIIMPVFNGEKYLIKAIDSILNQTYKDFEFIIIDGGSSDNSKEIIENYTDERIMTIYKANYGLVDSLNLGISLSRANWIARMDADDISYPNRFEEQLKYINEDIAIIGSQADIIDKDDKIFGTTSFKVNHDEIVTDLVNQNSTLIHPSVVINKFKLNLAGGYDPKMLSAEDYDLWLRISKVGKIINVNKTLFALRKHESNVSKIKLGATINNGFISLAYHFSYNSVK
jgi:glycosyltransferase involved in cell wall biosynthesis